MKREESEKVNIADSQREKVIANKNLLSDKHNNINDYTSKKDFKQKNIQEALNVKAEIQKDASQKENNSQSQPQKFFRTAKLTMDLLKAVREDVNKKIVNKAVEAGKNKIKKEINKMSPETIGKLIGDGYIKPVNWGAKKVYGKDAAGMLDISHEKIRDKKYIKDTIKFDSYQDERLKKYQSYLKDKIDKNFKHYKHIKSENVGGYYFAPDSEASKAVLNDKYMQEFIKNNKDNFLNGKKDMSVNFKTGNMYYAHHLADIIDYQFDNENNLEMVIADTNDFNEGDPNKLVQAGEIAMQKDELKPLFVLKHFIVPKEQIEKLWGKDYNKQNIKED